MYHLYLYAVHIILPFSHTIDIEPSSFMPGKNMLYNWNISPLQTTVIFTCVKITRLCENIVTMVMP